MRSVQTTTTYHCDRCRKEFQPSLGPYDFYWEFTLSSVIVGEQSHFDFCEACKKSFWSWMNSGLIVDAEKPA